MDTPLCFSAIFTGRENLCYFLFAYLDEESHSKMGSTLKGENLLLEGHFFPLITVDPYLERNVNGRVISLLRSPIYLNACIHFVRSGDVFYIAVIHAPIFCYSRKWRQIS